MKKYPKIPSPFKRFPNNRIDLYTYSSEEVKALASTSWTWTEKVDGANLRIHWDGHKVSFGGRADNAQLRMDVITYLQETFTEELLEQQFGEDQMTIFGEGVGPGVHQGSGRYAKEPAIILFDVFYSGSPGVWLKHESVVDVANNFNVAVTPVVAECGLYAAVAGIEDGLPSYFHSEAVEGIVGVAPQGLLNRKGERIQVKVKAVDFPGDTRSVAP